jgi:hypothetical protein
MHPFAQPAANPKRIFLATVLAGAFALLGLTAAPALAGGGVSADGDPTTNTAPADGGTSSKYERLWDRVSNKNKRWASRTAECESGKDPDAIGGGGRYRGAFQFMKATWRTSPKSPGGDPIAYDYKTQAVVAVALMRRDGDGHWPVCG